MAVVDANRGRGALARDADEAALHVDRRAAAHGRRGSRLLSLRRDDAAAARLRGCLLVRIHQLKLAVGGHRILYFLRRKCWSRRILRFGGNVFAYLRWKSAIARAYC